MGKLSSDGRNSIGIVNTLVIILVAIRLFFIFSLPLMDKTEARYAEIARIMAKTGNWITPQIDYGFPFWAKPPLSTWLSAISIRIFGVTEFAVRLPYFFIGIFLIFLTGRYARLQGLPFFLPGLVVLTIPEFLLHVGVVSTDMALSACISIVMLSFWESVRGSEEKYWRYLFFIGMGAGLLAKGPIMGILTLPPLFLWTFYTRSFYRVFLAFPWKRGILLTLSTFLPWYVLAEIATPGFLDYFIIGEHFKRFLDASWQGDKYGFPKKQPFGMAWGFLLVFALPWIQVGIFKVIKTKKRFLRDKWVVFLLFWIFWIPFFFMGSSSLIHPYILPSTVPIALLVVHYWRGIRAGLQIARLMTVGVMLLCFFYTYAIATGKNGYYLKSDKYLLEQIKDKNKAVFHFKSKSYSGQFYSNGRLKKLKTEQWDAIQKYKGSYLIIKNRDLEHIPKEVGKRLVRIDKNKHKPLYKIGQ